MSVEGQVLSRRQRLIDALLRGEFRHARARVETVERIRSRIGEREYFANPDDRVRYPEPPANVAAARDEYVRGFFDLDDSRRTELLEIMKSHCATVVETGKKDGRSTKKCDWRLTVTLAAEHCYGCHPRVLLGDDELEQGQFERSYSRRRGDSRARRR